MKPKHWRGKKAVQRRGNEAMKELARADEVLIMPREAAVELQPTFRRLARALWPDDKSTQDDLVQEMSLGALRCDEPHTHWYYLQRALSRAVDYLRWWVAKETPEPGSNEPPKVEELPAREKEADLAKERCEKAVAAA